MNDWKESGKKVKKTIKNTHRHESIKHDWANEHRRTKLLFEVKNNINSTRGSQKQDD